MSLWQIWWMALAVKTSLLPIIPITPDEAYYLVWARHPALSYFDHPPVIAWMMKIALPLWKTTLGIRWPGVILSHLGYLPWIGILKKLKFSNESQIVWMLALLFGPLTGLGGFVITPDVPMVFFWSLSIWILLWIYERPESIGRWLLLGLTVGLGMLSKYSMVLFFPATFVWLYWEKKLRYLAKPGPFLAALLCLAVFSPVIIWNYQHGFASFMFQTHHGLAMPSFKWNLPFEYIGTQMALLNPIVALIGFYVIWKNGSKNKLLLAFTATPFLFFFLTSFRARVEANWPVCAYPSFMALAATIVDTKNAWAAAWLKRGIKLSVVFVLLVISHTVRPWLPIGKDKDHTEITREWLIDVPAVRGYFPLYARSYQMAAFHSYYRVPEHEVFKLAGLDRVDVYDYLDQSTPKGSSYIILKADDRFPPHIESKYLLKNPRVLPSKLVLYDLVPR